MLPYKLLFLFTLISSAFCGVFYKYGEAEGDHSIGHPDRPQELDLKVPMKYGSELRRKLFIYPSGIVSFDSELPSDDLDTPSGHNAIAPFYIPTTSGTVYFRDTRNDQKLFGDLVKLVRRNFRHDREFRPLYAVIITWDGMSNEKAGDKKNVFQLVMVTDEMSSYALFSYESIDWPGIGERYASSGLYLEEGIRTELPASGQQQASELPRISNIYQPGQHLYGMALTPANAFGEPPENEESAEDDDEGDDDAEGEDDSIEKEDKGRCPPDQYHGHCPEGCEVLTDERDCSMCICTLPSQGPQETGPEEPIDQFPEREPHVPEDRPDVEGETGQEPSETKYPGPHHPEEEDREPEEVEEPAQPQPEPVHPHPQRPERPGHPYPPYHPPETTHAPPRQPDQQGPRIGEGAWYPGSTSGHRLPEGYNLPLTCAAASVTKPPCHSHARCIDRHTGFCCECEEGYYGNGEECLKKGDNERIFGTFEGVINGETVKNSTLHTFANTAKGQAYIALTGLNTQLGKSLLLADEISSVIGWLYAKIDSPGAYNGFMLTGGIFNRTVSIHFGDTHALMVNQHFTGRDVHNYFQVQMYITGTIPHVEERSPVVYPPRDVEYRREGPGFVRSYSIYNVIIQEQGFERPVRISVDQQIYYKECPFKSFDKEPVVVVKVTRPHVVYDAEERNVRYAAENKAMNGFNVGRVPYRPGDRYRVPPPPLEEQRPTQPPYRRHDDDQPMPTQPRQGEESHSPCGGYCTLPHMECVLRGGRAGCACENGYTVKIDQAAEPLGWRCEDVDECRTRTHQCSPNAQCHNTEGGHQCTCNPGYSGDGHECHRTGEPSPVEGRPSGPGCRSHSDCHMYGECVFGQNGQPGYCKCRGHLIGDGVSHCAPPPAYVTTPQPDRQCGFYICDVHADCVTGPKGTKNCRCHSGYIGIGVVGACELRTPEAGSVPVGSICTSRQVCIEHADCVRQNDGQKRCVCVPPHVPHHGRCVSGQVPTQGPPQPAQCNVINNCDRNADCVADGAFYRCICRPGFVGNGYTCSSTSAGPLYCDRLRNCGANAACEYDSQRRHHVCRCLSGFRGNGYSCVPTPTPPTPRPTRRPAENRCRDKTECHRFAHCVPDAYGENTCECLNGFKGDGIRECRAVEECDPRKAAECHPNAKCIYSQMEGAFKCQCNDGFVGDGRTCSEDKQPCNRDPSVCVENARCVFSDHEQRYTCVCNSGWAGDGFRHCHMTQGQECALCSTFARCVQKPTGEYACECKPGYQGSGRVCSPLATCLVDRSICDANAQCMPDSHGNYICNCNFGYHGDGRTCTPDRVTRDALLISRGASIIQRGMDSATVGKQVISKNRQLIVGIDYDCEAKRVYWANQRGSIGSSFLNGTDDHVVLTHEGLEGIVGDWASQNIYYVDTTPGSAAIYVSSLNGKYHKRLMKEGLTSPRFLALDIPNRHLYYSDWYRQTPKIGRMNMDGTEQTVIVETDLQLPNGLVLIPRQRELCWSDAGLHRIACQNLDNGGRRVVYAGLSYPFDLVFYGNNFYWTDWTDMKLHTVSVDGHGYSSFDVAVGPKKPYGITIAYSSCERAPTPCAVDNGGCPYICLPGHSEAKCVCPDNAEDLEGCSAR